MNRQYKCGQASWGEPPNGGRDARLITELPGKQTPFEYACRISNSLRCTSIYLSETHIKNVRVRLSNPFRGATTETTCPHDVVHAQGGLMNMKPRGNVMITAGFLIGLALPASAIAYGPSGMFEPVEVRVPYSGLDLDSVAGATVLYWRLKEAVADACGPTSLRLAGSLRQVRLNQTCSRELLDRAVEQADSDLLRHIHTG